MIKYVTVIGVSLITFLPYNAISQAPNKFSYQAVIRNSSNALVTNSAVGMRISILQTSATGTAVYVETQTPNTNINGLASLEIGGGTVVSGNFSSINWANGPFFIKTETDPAGGTNYTIIGVTQMLSVPYALFAENAGNSIPGPQGPAGLNGADGNGISSTVDNGDGTFTFNYDDGSVFTTSNLTGPQGAIGPQGLLTNGSVAGNTPFWNGSAWIINNSNIHNNGTEVGIGTTTPNSSAKLEVNSTSQGFLPPRLTSVQRDAIVSPAIGLVIYNTTSNCLNFYIGNGWSESCGILIGGISTLNCSNAIINDTLFAGSTSSGIVINIPYSGGNGGYYNGQIVGSTGVTGLTAALSSGVFANGSDTLSFIINGTPSNSGTASFTLYIGGQTCTLNISVLQPIPVYPAGMVHCTGTPTAVIDVTNPTTGKTWMDRNLGASQYATSFNDALAYGDLYQWGRRGDGHQCRNSLITNVLSSSNQPVHGNFIVTPATPYDWLSPQNANLWVGVNGINNPCPSGYRIPTNTEWQQEEATWGVLGSTGGWLAATPLRLPKSGKRFHIDGSLLQVDFYGYYWANNVNAYISWYLTYNNSGSSGNVMSNGPRGIGYSVRCIKN